MSMNDKIEQINELLNKLNEEERQTVLDSYTSQELLRKVWNNNDVIVPNYYDVDYIVDYNRCTREDAEKIIEYINDRMEVLAIMYHLIYFPNTLSQLTRTWRSKLMTIWIVKQRKRLTNMSRRIKLRVGGGLVCGKSSKKKK